MSDSVLFHMWGPFRRSLIAGHRFYVEQAQKRLLSQFEDIEVEARTASDEWLESNKGNFDPDRHDPGDFYEAANDAGIEFYSLLSGMREQTILSVVAGMFHEWDKQFRDWLAREMQHWHNGSFAAQKVWLADFSQIVELVESLGWKISGTEYFVQLDACRLVVNVYKHGRGKSLEDLRHKYPEYLEDQFSGSGGIFSGIDYRDYTNLKVTKDQFDAFSVAIITFWQNLPDYTFASQTNELPEWLRKALKKDHNDQTEGKTK